MANNIQIEFSPDDLRAINLGDQNRFAFHFWSREKVTEGINDAAPAASHNCIWIVAKPRTIIGREVAPEVELVAR